MREREVKKKIEREREREVKKKRERERFTIESVND